MNLIELDEQLAVKLGAREPYAAIDTMCEHALPEYLVWWGCLCAWSTWRPSPPQPEDESLSIASRWVFARTDDLRLLAFTLAGSPEPRVCRFLLKAVVNSGGTLTIEGQPVKQPTPNYSGKFILGFVHQLLSVHPPVKRVESAQTFVQLARQALVEPLPAVEPAELVFACH